MSWNDFFSFLTQLPGLSQSGKNISTLKNFPGREKSQFSRGTKERIRFHNFASGSTVAQW